MLRAGGAAVLAASLPGCDLPQRGPPVPIDQTPKASVLGIANERFFPVHGVDPFEAEFIAAMDRQMKVHGVSSIGDLPELQLLAISGGGENGAFGAGLLCGWSAEGSRPTFDLVTGVSTGALTAPFAFLGSAYDPQLRTVYTETPADQILSQRSITAALLSDAMADNTPLYRTISRFVDERMLAAIAAAYDQGRMLLIGTTDLDAQLPVVW
ncbi:MAG: patatin-like phospholipase family protein, partial [Alphaproteobacteria bacterium]|nr:patatin-like phospholipase family protein [Alphaproteobacteria bacterium]